MVQPRPPLQGGKWLYGLCYGGFCPRLWSAAPLGPLLLYNKGQQVYSSLKIFVRVCIVNWKCSINHKGRYGKHRTQRAQRNLLLSDKNFRARMRARDGLILRNHIVQKKLGPESSQIPVLLAKFAL